MLLGVNIDHIATLREARKTSYPNVVDLALVAQNNGADAITLHLREDRRHIQESDLKLLKKCISKRINLEMSTSSEMLNIALKYQPDDCCLVPENRQELTTEGGLDVVNNFIKIKEVSKQLSKANILVSLFIEPDEKSIYKAVEIGVPKIELHTGKYANAEDNANKQIELNKIKKSVNLAKSLGLTVNAGHGLHYTNVQNIVKISQINELNIGHSIIARAIVVGLKESVIEMKKIIQS